MANFTEGARVRRITGGETVTLSDINPDYGKPGHQDEAWATASSSDGFNDVTFDSPEEVELVMSATDAAARTLPTADEILRSLNLLDSNNVVSLHEVDFEGAGTALIFGQATNGLRLSFKVTISQVERELL